MIATILSAALVVAVPLAFVHGHTSGIRQVYTEAAALAEARRLSDREGRT